MRLDNLHLQNFRCYEDAHFDFQPGFNLVVGVNGSGKTSLLQGVAASFSNILHAMGSEHFPLSETDARFTVLKFEDRFRFERKFPLRLTAKGDTFELSNWDISLNRNIPFPTSSTSLQIQIQQQLKTLDFSATIDFPIISFYRANRRWLSNNTSVESALQRKASRLDAYKNWSDAAANLKDFEDWLIGKTLERLQRLSRTGPTNSFNDELTWVNAAIKRALPLSNGIEYDMDLRSLMVDLGEKLIPFNDLSDGQRGVVALFADIARRICLLNPHMGQEVLERTSGVIIIDELDIHLHPGWQRSIAPALKKAFPKIQFVAASHSPQIIGSLQPEEVILLHNGDSSHPRVTYGLDSSSILAEVMGVEQRLPEIEESLNEMFTSLENNELEKARQQLKALKNKAPDLPEYAGAEALLRRKEIIGR
ncbi:AAA family ATPase [Pseudomonas cichorii]|uniref:AAA family ATPase n=1 Tax=Pseudomonas cichorii TaxID=36746 RepID=UPI001C8AC17E|nr:AAA family ATPase [Pseudomonas cichorii]MBX8494215.1 AAA family ATPase [Pseudomonas cichorii]